MANRQHLAILEQGTVAWNKWRVDNSDIRPDLSHADLFNVELSRANLYRTKLILADLRSSHLVGADLRRSDLRGAYLTDTILDGADFSGASLEDVRLDGSDLKAATFGSTRLNNASFVEVIMYGTNMNNVDLSNVKGLDSVRHHGPSSIGIDTIYKSGGNIPEAFLRGCGLADSFITFMRSLTAQALEFYSCFISYSSKNQEFASRLHADLQASGVRCWFAPEDLRIGDKFRQSIDESIRLHDKMLLVLSEDSISSTWVEDEVESALERERRERRLVLFPVRIDEGLVNTQMAWAASLRRQRHIGDFTNWKDHDAYQTALDRLLRDLNSVNSIP